MRSPLMVWLYGTPIASLREDGERLQLAWTSEALRRWPINSTVLSVLLPITGRSAPSAARVRAFFAGLLPEGDARRQLALEAGVAEDDVFGMIRAYGRDVAGALVVQSESEPEPGHGRGEWRVITAQAIAEKLERASSNVAPLGVEPGVTSLSLAGLQPKIALHRSSRGEWMECVEGAPSTWILKPGRPAGSPLSDLIHNEAACLDLARRLGLSTVEAEVETFEEHQALVVRRYDRIVNGEQVERIHQEDAAQVLGLNTDSPDRKFQFGRALPSLSALAAVLDQEYASKVPLLGLTTFNVAIGNTDAHAKNISVLHAPDGQLSLAPAYDVSPHRHYAAAGSRAAMDVNGLQDIDEIGVSDLIAEATSWGMPEQVARAEIDRVLVGLSDRLRDGFGAEHQGVPDAVLAVMHRRTTSLLDGRGAGR